MAAQRPDDAMRLTRPAVVLGAAMSAGAILSIPMLGLAGAPRVDGIYWIPIFAVTAALLGGLAGVPEARWWTWPIAALAPMLAIATLLAIKATVWPATVGALVLVGLAWAVVIVTAGAFIGS